MGIEPTRDIVCPTTALKTVHTTRPVPPPDGKDAIKLILPLISTITSKKILPPVFFSIETVFFMI